MGEELDGLKAELARLQYRVDEIERADRAAGAEPTLSRRTAFKALGVAAAGAAVGTIAFASPGGAAEGGNVIIGNETQTNPSPTVLRANGMTTGSNFGAFHVTDEASPSVNTAAALSAVVGIASNDPLTTGLLGATSTTAGAGAKLDGPYPLKLSDSTNAGAPSLSVGQDGQFRYVASSGDLWFCVDDSGSDRWRRLTGQAVSGGFVAIDPARVYDSRWVGIGGLLLGVLNSGVSRIVQCATKRDVNGGVVTANIVPAGARAIAYNLTIADTTGTGFLSCVPGGSSDFSASAINWSSGGQLLANGSTVKLNTSRQVTVFCGGGGSTNFIIDVVGYYFWHALPSEPGAAGGWRFAFPADTPFLYRLAVTLEPRWWRLTRMGDAPTAVLHCLEQCNARAIVFDEDGAPVGAAVLAEGSLVAMTAVLDLHALPTRRAERIVRSVAPDIVRAAFVGADTRRLYYTRFEDDPDVLGDLLDMFDEEVRFPEYALVDSSYRDRIQYCLTAERYFEAFPEDVGELPS